MCQGIWLGGSTYEFLKGEAVHWVMHCDMQYPVDSFDLAKRLGFKIISYDKLDEEQRAAAYETSEDAFFIDKDGEKELDENSTIDNYVSIVEQLKSIEAVIDSIITTGISTAVTAQQFANGEVYDLNGRRVMKPAKGLFVVGGKKVMVK